VDEPRSFLSTLEVEFFSLTQTGLETALHAGRPHRGMECRQRLWISMSGTAMAQERPTGRSGDWHCPSDEEFIEIQRRHFSKRTDSAGKK
jgi:hypothetical protein